LEKISWQDPFDYTKSHKYDQNANLPTNFKISYKIKLYKTKQIKTKKIQSDVFYLKIVIFYIKKVILKENQQISIIFLTNFVILDQM